MAKKKGLPEPQLGWPKFIAIIEEHLALLELKKVQLTALLAVCRRRQLNGEMSPFEVLNDKSWMQGTRLQDKA